MIEDLLYRIQSKVEVATAEAAIADLPVEYGLVLDLYFAGELTRQEIAALLDWSPGSVSQRLTRGISLLKYQLCPEAFSHAKTILRSGL